MRILDRYIYNQFARYFLATFVVAIAMVWLTQTLRFVDLITARGVSLYIFMKITLQLIIPMVYFIMPIAALISTIFLLYHLYYDREIVIFRNSGLSNWQIVRPIIHCCILLTVMHYVVSFYLLPKTYRDFKDDREYYKNRFLSLFLEEGVFNTQSNSLTLYIDEKVDENYFKGIFIHDMQKPDEAVTIIAESGYILRTDVGSEFVLYNGTHQKKALKTGNISITTFNSYKFSIQKYQPTNVNRTLESNELYIYQLFSSFDTNDKDARENLVNGNQRILWPLYTVLLPLVAGAALLVGQFSRKGILRRTVSVSAVAIIFIMFSMLFNSIATRHLWVVIFMYLNAVLIVLTSVKLLTYRR